MSNISVHAEWKALAEKAKAAEAMAAEAMAARQERGITLYRERAEEIERLGFRRYRIPGSCGNSYTVDLAAETCTCPDFEHYCTEQDINCKHIIAAAIYRERRDLAGRRCNYRFLELLEEDYGISQFALRSAFLGVPAARKRRAIALCEWATELTDDPEEAGELVRSWAREHGEGMYHPAILGAPELTYEQSARERAIREERS